MKSLSKEIYDERTLLMVGVENVMTVDYGHFLGNYDGKCNRLHYHTSWTSDLFVWGYKRKDARMLIDYGVLKNFVKEELSAIDHKLVVKYEYVKEYSDNKIWIEYEGRKAELFLTDVYVVPFDVTAENLAAYIVKNVFDKLPENVIKVQFKFREGVNNVVDATMEREYVWE